MNNTPALRFVLHLINGSDNTERSLNSSLIYVKVLQGSGRDLKSVYVIPDLNSRFAYNMAFCMISRAIQEEFQTVLTEYPVVTLLGPR
jgi:hypothetical protein